MAAPLSPPNADELREAEEWRAANGMELDSDFAFTFETEVEAEAEGGRGVAKMWRTARNALTPSLGASVRDIYRREAAKVVMPTPRVKPVPPVKVQIPRVKALRPRPSRKRPLR